MDGKNYEVKSPDLHYVDDAEEIVADIKTSLEKGFRAAQSCDYETACEYLDVESFAETYIINELMGNPDVYYGSFYLYKDVGGKITSGPVWDYDIGAGNVNYGRGNEYYCSPYIPLIAMEWNYWYAALFDIAEFREMVNEKLVYYKDAILETIELANPENEDGIYAKYGQAMERNFEKWQIMGKYVWPEPQNVYEIDTVTGQLEFLRNWLTERYCFVCEQYGVEI